MKRLLVLLIVLAAATGTVFAATAIKNPDTFIDASFGDVVTLDPAVGYDTTSWAVYGIVYDRLIDFDGTTLDKFKPMLATEVPTVANGGISADAKTYTFKIRQGVKFHNGDVLTPSDVAYTFERAMVTDPADGPDWIWYQVFMAGSGSRDANDNIAVKFSDIDKAIEVKGNTVVFHLANPFPPFLSVVAGRWASIVDKKWVIAQGGWDGTEATWQSFNNPATGKETLFEIANGTGPYKLVRWTKKVELAVDRNDAYWGPKPALAHGIRKDVEEWSTRKLMLLQGDVDYAETNATNYPEMDKETSLQMFKTLPTLTVNGIHFNMKIATKDNPAVGSGQLDGNGVPADFFTDINVRLGFIYAWDEKTFLRDIMTGNAIDPVTPFPVGLPYKNMKLESKPFDLQKAADYFKKAWGGKVWANGFKLDLVSNSSNMVRELGLKMLAENVASINPKFQVTMRDVQWADFLNARKNKQLPAYFLGWAPDYPDPDDYAQPYLASSGNFPATVGYSNPTADKLVAAAGIELDPTKRQVLYYQLQDIWLQDAPGIIAYQPTVNRYFQNWVKGYFWNPMESEVFERLPYFSKR